MRIVLLVDHICQISKMKIFFAIRHYSTKKKKF